MISSAAGAQLALCLLAAIAPCEHSSQRCCVPSVLSSETLTALLRSRYNEQTVTVGSHGIRLLVSPSACSAFPEIDFCQPPMSVISFVEQVAVRCSVLSGRAVSLASPSVGPCHSCSRLRPHGADPVAGRPAARRLPGSAPAAGGGAAQRLRAGRGPRLGGPHRQPGTLPTVTYHN